MERNDYLHLCQKCAMADVVPVELMVEYEGIKYIPSGYKMKFDKNGVPRNVAILKDMFANSIVECLVDKVVKI